MAPAQCPACEPSALSRGARAACKRTSQQHDNGSHWHQYTKQGRLPKLLLSEGCNLGQLKSAKVKLESAKVKTAA